MQSWDVIENENINKTFNFAFFGHRWVKEKLLKDSSEEKFNPCVSLTDWSYILENVQDGR